MKFTTNRLKPVIIGKTNGKDSRMLIDSGADYVILNVPKYSTEYKNDIPVLDKNGNYKRIRMYSDTEYDELIRKQYGTFVTNKKGEFIKTVVHGFGDIKSECRLITLNNFSIDSYVFTDSYVLLDEYGFAKNYDMIIGTAALRNFRITLDYCDKDIQFTQRTKEVRVNYEGILANDSKVINSSIELPPDIYLKE